MLFNYQSFLPNFDKEFVTFFTKKKTVLFFHILTTGTYWRTSKITGLQILEIQDFANAPFEIKCWNTETEEDEYELLVMLSSYIQESDCVIGYNSTSFHLPYLKNKYKAYGLTDPFSHTEHMDLLKLCKPTGAALSISMKLSDLRLYFKLDDNEPELKVIVYTLQLLKYKQFFFGDFSVTSVEKDTDCIYAKINTNIKYLEPLHLNHDAFYLMLEEHSCKVMIRLFDGALRVYYPNYKDYYYLASEDMIIHKSMCSGISKDKLIKATCENCYQKIVPPKEVSIPYLTKYLTMLFQYFYNTLK